MGFGKQISQATSIVFGRFEFTCIVIVQMRKMHRCIVSTLFHSKKYLVSGFFCVFGCIAAMLYHFKRRRVKAMKSFQEAMGVHQHFLVLQLIFWPKNDLKSFHFLSSFFDINVLSTTTFKIVTLGCYTS